MADGSMIEWTDATWNPITGCSVKSPGCAGCYAMELAGTRLRHHPSRVGLTRDTKAGPVWTGQVRFNPLWLDQPLRWTRPRMIFVCAHSDLFHGAVPDAWIDQVFAVMALAPHHTYQVLTKRTERMRTYLSDPGLYARVLEAANVLRAARPALARVPVSDPLNPAFWPHIWLGFSAEDQCRLDERVPDMRLLAAAGWMTWCSAEPLLGPIDISGLGWLRWLTAMTYG